MAIALGQRVRWPGLTARAPAWQRQRRFPPLAIAAAVAALGVAVLLVYIYLPKATVVLYPRTQPIEDAVDLRADPAAIAVDVRGHRVPARVGYVVVDVFEQTTTLGRLPDPNARAAGTLTLANRSVEAVSVPAGSLVMSASGVRFTTTADVTLDAAVGSLARVAIRALQPGETGNLGRLEVNRIVGPLATRVAVLNEEPTVGGGQGSVAVVSAEDVARARSAAAERARVDAMSQLGAATLPDELLLTGSVDAAVVEESLDRQVGERATGFTYRLKTRVTATRIAREDLRQIVRESWQPAVPLGHFLPEQQLEIGTPNVVGVDRGVVALRVPVRTLAVQQVDPAVVAEAVRGREPDDARRALGRALPLAAEPRVSVQPPWFGRAQRVGVAIDLNPPATATPQPE